MKFESKLLAVLVSAFAAANAHALTTSVTVGKHSSVLGATEETFESGLPSNYSGGGIFSASVHKVASRPAGSTGNFLSFGVSGSQSSTGVVDLGKGASYFGFLWGSPDKYNSVTFFDGLTALGTFDGSAIVNPTKGSNGSTRFFNVFAGAGEVITSVVFKSGKNAFETDNHAVVAVPEPATYAMLLAGLGMVGLLARKRLGG